MNPKLSIAVVEQDRERALMIVDGLRDAGDYDVTVIGDVTGLARRLAALAPDVVLIDLESPDRDVLDALTMASTPTDRPLRLRYVLRSPRVSIAGAPVVCTRAPLPGRAAAPCPAAPPAGVSIGHSWSRRNRPPTVA